MDLNTITAESLKGWINTANGGDKLDYYRGYLMRDREFRAGLPKDRRSEIIDVAEIAMRAYRSGIADLVQQRNGLLDYTYRIIFRNGSAK